MKQVAVVIKVALPSLVFHALQAQRTMKRVLAAGLVRVAG